MALDGRQVGESLKGQTAQQNARKLRPIPEHLRNVPPVYIFNIYDQAHNVPLGGWGSRYIPACPPGKPYSDPCVVQGTEFEYFDAGEGQSNWNAEDGRAVAKDIVGIGSYNDVPGPLTTNREHWGVFIAAGATPTKEELAKAKKKLTAQMVALVNEADKLALQGEKGLAQIDPMHRKAVAYLNQKRKWADMEQEELVECQGCGTSIRPGFAQCSACGAVLDPVKHRTLYPHLYQQAAVKG